MTYGVKTVVGGFSRELTDQEYIPMILARTYEEHRMLRRVLGPLSHQNFHKAAEFGCGYGRMTPVLKEFAPSVVAFERDQELLFLASMANPGIEFVCPQTLEHVPANDQLFDLILTYTVIQHMRDEECRNVLQEISRVMKLNGVLVLCEQTDPNEQDATTHGRAIVEYSSMLPEFKGLGVHERLTEGNPAGHYMVFRKTK